MRIAQMKAVSINTNYGVRFPSATTYILEYLTTGGWVSEGAQETLPAGVQFTAFPPLNGGPDPNFQFYPNSMASTGGLTLNNTKGATKTVLLGLTGRIKIE
jgi:hypothetical protein